MDLVINYHNFYEKRIMDLGLLQYVFRSIEQNANLFNKIYFIYDGNDTSLPNWLDTSFLTLIKHEDFVPSEFLPTFNEHTIEMFMHEINGLSEEFVYIKENTFFMNKLSSDDFFKNGKSIISYAIESRDQESLTTEKFCSDLSEWISIEANDDSFNDHIIIPEKGASPLFKSTNNIVNKKLLQIIKSSNGIFENKYDIPYNIFLCAEIRKHITENGIKRDLLELSEYEEGLINILNKLDCDILSVDGYKINNQEQFEYVSNTMNNFLSEKFSKKSKFEK